MVLEHLVSEITISFELLDTTQFTQQCEGHCQK